ncbi:hypothetical protein EDC01DRAFT_275401 [Geopyxis carbonaria]|nr:hypothetical protein EDC01DRAFT_275401 [Geopyxis carbonaria]
MFNLPRKLTRRNKKSSPYDSELHDGSVNYDGPGGSTVSLPTLFGSRSYTSGSSHSNKSFDPRNQALNSRMDPEAPLHSAPATQLYHHPLRVRRNKELPPPSRPATFYSLVGSAIDSTMGRRDRIRQNSFESTTSPVALPHKALALLGIKEQSGFGTPPSPITIDNSDLMYDEHDHENRPTHLNLHNQQLEDRWGRLDEWRQTSKLAGPPVSVPIIEYTPSPSYSPTEPPPERLYFRPQSLCSSFSTNSEHTVATTVTTMTATSPSIGSIGNPKENGTLDSESTIKEISMLNLDDSGSESEYEDESEPTPTNKRPEISVKKGELPSEIALQICSYFSSETHLDDVPEYLQSEYCPNCAMYTLWSLSLTSRAWSKAACATLYRIISLDFGYYTLPTRAPDGKGIPPSFVPYSCSEEHTKTDVEAKLPLLYRTIWDSGGFIGDQILGIKIPRRLFSVTKYPLSAILQKCPNIEFVDHAVCTGAAEDLVPILSGLKHIKRWTWKREQGVKYEQTKIRQKRMTAMVELKKTMPGPPPELALHVLPEWTSLEHLELNNLRRLEIPDSFDFTVLPKLRSVSLRHLGIVDRNPETRFLARLPALEHLEIDTCLFITPQRIVDYLTSGAGQDLISLILRDTSMPVSDLYEILPHTPKLRSLSVSSTSTAPTPSPTSATPHQLPEMTQLRYIDIDMRPLVESFRFLLDVVDASSAMSCVRAGRRPEPKLVPDEVTRLIVKLQMGCKFAGVELIM